MTPHPGKPERGEEVARVELIKDDETGELRHRVRLVVEPKHSYEFPMNFVGKEPAKQFADFCNSAVSALIADALVRDREIHSPVINALVLSERRDAAVKALEMAMPMVCDLCRDGEKVLANQTHHLVNSGGGVIYCKAAEIRSLAARVREGKEKP